MNFSETNVSFSPSTAKGTTVWVVSQAIVTACTVIDLYILICLVQFWKGNSQVFTCCKNTPSFLFRGRAWVRGSNRSDRVGGRSESNERKYRIWMIRLAISSVVVALLKFLTDQIKFFAAWDARSDVLCEVANDVTEVALFGMSTLFVYAFLWVRQWMFYHNPAVRSLLYTKHLIRFSRLMPLIILVLSGLLLIFHFLPWRYRADKNTGPNYLGCVSVYSIKNPDEAWPILLYIAITSVVQISLLALFLYPLIQRKYDMWKNVRTIRHTRLSSSISSSFGAHAQSNSLAHPSHYTMQTEVVDANSEPNPNAELPKNNNVTTKEAETGETTNQQQTKGRCLHKLCTFIKKDSTPRPSDSDRPRPPSRNPRVIESVQRAVIWTGLCILSDTALVAVSVNMGPGTALVLISSLSSVNVLFNQFCIVASYRRWREIILPRCLIPVEKRRRLGHLYESTLTITAARNVLQTNDTQYDQNGSCRSKQSVRGPSHINTRITRKFRKFSTAVGVPKSSVPAAENRRTSSL
ncbi:uncharacterized protein LOC100177146 [Ciona intestinalis]